MRLVFAKDEQIMHLVLADLDSDGHSRIVVGGDALPAPVRVVLSFLDGIHLVQHGLEGCTEHDDMVVERLVLFGELDQLPLAAA